MDQDSKNQRGSRKLLEERFGVRGDITPEEITRLIDILDQSDIEVSSLLTKGIPPVVDMITGEARVSLNRAGELVAALAQLGFHIDVFPNGIPAVDAASLRFER